MYLSGEDGAAGSPILTFQSPLFEWREPPEVPSRLSVAPNWTSVSLPSARSLQEADDKPCRGAEHPAGALLSFGGQINLVATEGTEAFVSE